MEEKEGKLKVHSTISKKARGKFFNRIYKKQSFVSRRDEKNKV